MAKRKNKKPAKSAGSKKKTITSIIYLLLMVALIMAFAFYLPWAAIGVILLIEFFRLVIPSSPNKRFDNGKEP